MDALSTLLEELGLARYTAIFAENDVDLEALRLLSDAELEKLGVSLGHRKKLLKAIAELDGVVPAAQLTVVPTGRQASDADTAPAVVTTEAGERRQLTVLFCDMVRFTELANRVDPEVLQRIMCGVHLRATKATCSRDWAMASWPSSAIRWRTKARPSVPFMRDSRSLKPCPGSRCQVVLLSGEPGIGKSHILSALRERLEAQG